MRFSLLILAFGLATACSSKSKSVINQDSKDSQAAEKAEAAVAKATDQASQPMTAATRAECSTKGDSRILEVRGAGKGCELAYTKSGKEDIVASAANGRNYCETTMNKIRDRLKAAGFECK
jgi:hypothetical protein